MPSPQYSFVAPVVLPAFLGVDFSLRYIIERFGRSWAARRNLPFSTATPEDMALPPPTLAPRVVESLPLGGGPVRATGG